METSFLCPNCSALAKFAAYLQSIILYLTESEIYEIKDDDKGLIFVILERHGPISIAVD